MKKEDYKKFAALMLQLREVYGGDMTDEMIEIYYCALEELTIDQLKGALKVVLKTWKYTRIPPPAQILSAAFSAPASSAISVWNHIIGLAGRRGADRKPSFDESIEQAINAVGGWRKICHAEERELESIRNHFLELYRTSPRLEVLINSIRSTKIICQKIGDEI